MLRVMWRVDAEHCGRSVYPPIGRRVARDVADTIEELGQGDHKTGKAWKDAFGFDEEDSPCIDFYATMGVVYEGREIIFPPAFQHFPVSIPIKACPNLLSVCVAEWRLATQNPPACVSINDGIWDTRIAVFSNSTQRYECASPATVQSIYPCAVVDTGCSSSDIGGDRDPYNSDAVSICVPSVSLTPNGSLFQVAAPWRRRTTHVHDEPASRRVRREQHAKLHCVSHRPLQRACCPQWDASLVAAVRGLVVRPEEGIIRMFKFGDVARHGQSLFNHSAVPFRGGISVLELRLDGESAAAVSVLTWSSIETVVCRVCFAALRRDVGRRRAGHKPPSSYQWHVSARQHGSGGRWVAHRRNS